MRKVLLLTVHRTLNYGSVLQTYACRQIFERAKCEMIVADYSRPTDYTAYTFQSFNNYVKLRMLIKKCRSAGDKLKCIATSAATYKLTRKFWNVCNSFLKDNVILSTSVNSMEALKNLSKGYDIVCAGSDQIWNSEYNDGTDKVYLLAFVDNKKKISLASSIGKEKLTEDDVRNFNKYLCQFEAVSVREDKAKELLNEVGIAATQLLDPTLWLTKEEWLKKTSKRLVDEPYLLLYKLKADDTIDQIAEVISRNLGVKIVHVSFSDIPRNAGKNEQYIVLPQVQEFLSLIANAEFIVTNSFHGTCFSINFNKNFVSVPRGKYNSRIEGILNVIGLSERFLSVANTTEISNIMEPIDYQSINEVLAAKRVEAFNWLTSAVSEKEA